MENRLEPVRNSSAFQTFCDVAFLLSLTLLVATVVLWIRSAWRCDVASIEVARPEIYLASSNGEMRVEFPKSWVRRSPGGRYRFNLFSNPVATDPDRGKARYLGFGLASQPFVPLPVVPHWFVATLFAAAIAWRGTRHGFRFKLASVLIATTVICLLIGGASAIKRYWDQLPPEPNLAPRHMYITW
jgi:hypothetical protein